MVWGVPKSRRQVWYAELRKPRGPVLRELARQREVVGEEGHRQLDHVHRLLAIPPNYAGVQVLGAIRGRAPSTVRGAISGGGKTSRASSSGPAATTCPPVGGTRPRFGRTSGSRERKTSVSINWTCVVGRATFRWRSVSQPL